PQRSDGGGQERGLAAGRPLERRDPKGGGLTGQGRMNREVGQVACEALGELDVRDAAFGAEPLRGEIAPPRTEGHGGGLSRLRPFNLRPEARDVRNNANAGGLPGRGGEPRPGGGGPRPAIPLNPGRPRPLRITRAV